MAVCRGPDQGSRSSGSRTPHCCPLEGMVAQTLGMTFVRRKLAGRREDAESHRNNDWWSLHWWRDLKIGGQAQKAKGVWGLKKKSRKYQMENWDLFLAKFCTAMTVPIAWGWTECLERAHMERIRSVSEVQWALRRGSFKSTVTGFALCPMS